MCKIIIQALELAFPNNNNNEKLYNSCGSFSSPCMIWVKEPSKQSMHGYNGKKGCLRREHPMAALKGKQKRVLSVIQQYEFFSAESARGGNQPFHVIQWDFVVFYTVHLSQHQFVHLHQLLCQTKVWWTLCFFFRLQLQVVK